MRQEIKRLRKVLEEIRRHAHVGCPETAEELALRLQEIEKEATMALGE